MSFLTNWKTTLAGVAALFLAVGALLKGLAVGDTSTLMQNVSLIIAGFGMIFAKDATPPAAK